MADEKKNVTPGAGDAPPPPPATGAEDLAEDAPTPAAGSPAAAAPAATSGAGREDARAAARMRRKSSDNLALAVRAAVVIGTLGLCSYAIWDYMRTRESLQPRRIQAIDDMPLPVPQRDVSPGGWLYGMKRVEIQGDRPWEKIGEEVYRRKLSPPTLAGGASLRDSHITVVLFTDGSYLQLKPFENAQVRALVCAAESERFGAVRALFDRCASGGAVALVLVRSGDEPATVQVALGALPLVKDARPVQVEVSPQPGGVRVTANGYGCRDFADLAAKLGRLRKTGGGVLVRLVLADSLTVGALAEALGACGVLDDPVYIALTPME